MSIKLHITNAGNQFTSSDQRVIRDAADSAWDFLDKHFKIDYDIDLIIAGPLQILPTIPEDGITARTYRSNFILLSIDTSQHKISEDTIFEIICHEMSHSVRWERVPEFANTLFENTIMEGLAVVLEEMALKEDGRNNQQFFLTTIQEASESMISSIICAFHSKMHSKHFNYEKDFFTGDTVLPRWSAYILGYYLVKKYLDETGNSIFDATTVSYSEFKKVLKV